MWSAWLTVAARRRNSLYFRSKSGLKHLFQCLLPARVQAQLKPLLICMSAACEVGALPVTNIWLARWRKIFESIIKCNLELSPVLWRCIGTTGGLCRAGRRWPEPGDIIILQHPLMLGSCKRIKLRRGVWDVAPTPSPWPYLSRNVRLSLRSETFRDASSVQPVMLLQFSRCCCRLHRQPDSNQAVNLCG